MSLPSLLALPFPSLLACFVSLLTFFFPFYCGFVFLVDETKPPPNPPNKSERETQRVQLPLWLVGKSLFGFNHCVVVVVVDKLMRMYTLLGNWQVGFSSGTQKKFRLKCTSSQVSE
eukprot:TRINITY_DN67398_c6_g2_i1.p2 TRINITY_DN67398_c6_g2~~TRINITY_DN67398_c6_g2_i1.p2  ORF type:complete len:116 (-),score=8.57 TRINITY_DN67398_c6_g2_i1:218-565(-)